MDKALIESAIKRAKALPSSSDRSSVLANLEALSRHVRVSAGEKLTDDEKKLPCCAAYTRAQDIETDLAVLESRANINTAASVSG